MWKKLQRIVSRTEPELGLGAIMDVTEDGFLEVNFYNAGESRRYSARSAPLHRFTLRPGQRAAIKGGAIIEITEVQEDEDTGLLEYIWEQGRVWEYDLEDRVYDQGALEQFFSGHFTDYSSYELRREARRIRAESQSGGVLGLVGPRVQPLAHQLYIADQVAHRLLPRVVLADEVGLGKTIEAGLIFAAMRALDKANRVLIVTPPALVHQWMAELYRRFHTLFAVIDFDRMEEEQASQGMSAFSMNPLSIINLQLLKEDPMVAEEVLEQPWDLVIIDEAHHLHWDPEAPNEAWQVAEKLSKACRGLLLLTATPEQYGLASRFGLLHLVDPERFDDFDSFCQQQASHKQIADIATTVQEKGLSPEITQALKQVFASDAALLALMEQDPEPEEVLQMLVDRHGTGRVLYRNRRSRLKGFPKRILHQHPLEHNDATAKRLKLPPDSDELMVMDLATGRWNQRLPQIAAKDNPKIHWLRRFATEELKGKALVLCSSTTGVIQLASQLEDTGLKLAIFHEKLSEVERDQQAAKFANPDGPQILICSEIGGEGRNFQFANTLVFMDLPKHPDLVEQRIGRLDRIGQRGDVNVHVPFLVDSPEEVLFRWFHEGLDGFQSSWNGAAVILDEFIDDLFAALQAFIPGDPNHEGRRELLDGLLINSREFAAQVRAENEASVDYLLDLNSFDEDKGGELLEQVEDADDDPSVEFFMRGFFDHYGVDYEDFDDRGTILIKPENLSFVEKIPGISAGEESLMTFDRDTALKREEMLFLTRDHPIVEECLGMLLDRGEGVASLCKWPDSPHGSGLLMEFFIVLEATGPKDWELGRYLPPQTTELIYNHKGKRVRDKSHKNQPELLVPLSDHEQGLERERLAAMIEPIVAKSLDKASRWAEDKIEHATAAAKKLMDAEILRMRSLAETNPLVKEEEIEALTLRREGVLESIAAATPRVDAVRLVFTQ